MKSSKKCLIGVALSSQLLVSLSLVLLHPVQTVKRGIHATCIECKSDCLGSGSVFPIHFSHGDFKNSSLEL